LRQIAQICQIRYNRHMKSLVVKVDASGRILLPAKVRRDLHLKRGSELVMRLGKGSVQLKTRARALKEAQEYFSQFRRKGELWSDELIKERRQETRRERAT
jgi:AbrB family looped-hinge helix DNA binding protein